jgi:hypothetical protein
VLPVNGFIGSSDAAKRRIYHAFAKRMSEDSLTCACILLPQQY